MKTNTISEDEIKECYKATGKLSQFALEMKFHNGESSSRTPVGYKTITIENEKCVVKDEFKAPIVQVAFLLAGDGNMSLRAILKIVTDLGLTSRNGKNIGPSALWGILTNPFYMGKIRHHGLMRTGRHEPIVDGTVFHAVQRNLSARAKLRCYRTA